MMANFPKGFVPDAEQPKFPAGFVPDEPTASHPETDEEQALRESFLNKDRFKPSPIHARFGQPKGGEQPEQTRFDKFAESFSRAGRSIADAAGAAADTVGYQGRQLKRLATHPLDYARDIAEHPAATMLPGIYGDRQAQTDQLIRGLDNMVTFGAAQEIGDALNRKLRGVSAEQQREAAATNRELAPGYAELGSIAGTMVPGAANLTMRGAGAGVANTLGRVPVTSALPGAGLGVAKGLLGYELAVPAISAGQAVMHGENPIVAAREAATDPAGLTIAGTMGAIGGAGRGYANRLRDTKTLEGRTIRDVEAAGGTIKPFGKPASGGLFETPEMQDVKEGRAGVNEMAANSVQRLIQHNAERMEKARADFGDAADRILSEHADRHHIMSSTDEALTRLEAENTTRNGTVLDPGMAKTLKHVRDMITVDTGEIDAAATRRSLQSGGENAVTVTAPAVPVDDLIKIKRTVNKLADWKQPATPETQAYRQLAAAIDEDAAAVDPRIGEMNAAYRAEIEPVKKANDVLFGIRKPDVTPSEAQLRAATGRLGRIGDETQFGTIGDQSLERLGDTSPQAADELRMMAAKKALERLRYGEPETSTSIEKGMRRGHGKVLKHGAAAVGAALGGPAGAVIGYGLGQAADSAFPLRVRVGLPAAEALSNARGAAAMKLYLARREQQRRDAERVTQIGGQ